MDFELDLFVKVGGLMSLLVGSAYVNISHRWKTKGSQAELLEKLDHAIENRSPHLAGQLFLLIHGLKLSFSDIKLITSRDDCSSVVDALKRRKGSLSISDGRFFSRTGINIPLYESSLGNGCAY
ncbi:MAG: hypothetical protein ACFE0K_03675 [Alcanivorax sp.]|uniref:hypothetical protein n=1 Tax=Alcanivorax sp. TaxID=1872427 RepID=UPI003DA774AA